MDGLADALCCTDGVNHADSVAPEGMYAVDGLVALLKVTITAEPPS